jgi:LPPG:FO 2-phospho-L-lactate transferase
MSAPELALLAGGTGTPKLLAGVRRLLDPADVAVVGNTGDDVEIGGHLVCPDLDTVLFDGGDVLDRDRWWGIAGDTTATHDRLHDIAREAGLAGGPRYLPPEAQTAGRRIARHRRFSGVAEFMEIGDRDRAVHVTRTGLIDEGHTLTEVTRTLAGAFGLDLSLLPMSDDPVATVVHTDEGPMHFQAFWVAHRGAPTVEDVEFRGATEATTTPAVRAALSAPVVVGPSNPVTSVGPMLALDGLADALRDTPVVAVSPFVGDEAFSGPAPDLMRGTGLDPSTAGVAAAYPWADAFVLDDDDPTDLDRPVVRTDTRVDGPDDAERVVRAALDALSTVGADVTTEADR